MSVCLSVPSDWFNIDAVMMAGVTCKEYKLLFYIISPISMMEGIE